jgi:hypothetical protein
MKCAHRQRTAALFPGTSQIYKIISPIPCQRACPNASSIAVIDYFRLVPGHALSTEVGLCPRRSWNMRDSSCPASAGHKVHAGDRDFCHVRARPPAFADSPHIPVCPGAVEHFREGRPSNAGSSRQRFRKAFVRTLNMTRARCRSIVPTGRQPCRSHRPSKPRGYRGPVCGGRSRSERRRSRFLPSR